VRRLLSLPLLLWALAAGAQVDPVVRVAVTPETVRVGEALSLRVTVLVPTWFPRPPVYPDFELVNAITRLPPDSSFPTSERIDGESWSGIVREYRVYPLAAAGYRIDGASVRVTYANPGAGPVVRDVALPPVVFRGTVPAGAEGLEPYLAGRELQVSADVQGNDGELAVGDAVVLTYTAALDGLPSMFLPPLAPDLDALVEAGRVSVYADAPRYADDDGLATRSERLTLVFQAGGDYTVPAVAIDYWDTQAGEVRTAGAEALQLSVSGPALITDHAENAAGGALRWWPALLGGTLLLLAFFSVRAALPRARRWLAAWQVSEPRAFRDLRRALRSGPESQRYSALQDWLSRLEPGLSPRAFARDYGDAALQEAIEALSAHCFAGRGQEPQPRQLEQALAQARQRYHRACRRRRGGALAPLNP
jgi:hypothetical protein